MDDYEYYKIGCRAQRIRPIAKKRFLAAVARYERDRDSIDARLAKSKSKLYQIVQWSKLLLIIDTIEDGKILAGVSEPSKVAASTGWIDEGRPDGDWQWPDGNRDWDAGAPGVREPRRPIDPVLVDAAAKALPGIAAATEAQLAREALFAITR